MIVITKKDEIDTRFKDDPDAVSNYECTDPIIQRVHEYKIIVQVPWNCPDPQTQLLAVDHDYLVPPPAKIQQCSAIE